jgi:hypothetical protein
MDGITRKGMEEKHFTHSKASPVFEQREERLEIWWYSDLVVITDRSPWYYEDLSTIMLF